MKSSEFLSRINESSKFDLCPSISRQKTTLRKKFQLVEHFSGVKFHTGWHRRHSKVISQRYSRLTSMYYHRLINGTAKTKGKKGRSTVLVRPQTLFIRSSLARRWKFSRLLKRGYISLLCSGAQKYISEVKLDPEDGRKQKSTRNV